MVICYFAEGIGKASIIPENVQDNILFECHVIRLPLDLSKCVPEFMQTLSTMDFFRNQVVAQSKTATMTTIGQEGILRTDIILPPIDKQREFYDFVRQTDKSKFVGERSEQKCKICVVQKLICSNYRQSVKTEYMFDIKAVR